MDKQNFIMCTGDKDILNLGKDERRFFICEYSVNPNLNTEAFDVWKLQEPQNSYVRSFATEAEANRYVKQLQDQAK